MIKKNIIIYVSNNLTMNNLCNFQNCAQNKNIYIVTKENKYYCVFHYYCIYGNDKSHIIKKINKNNKNPKCSDYFCNKMGKYEKNNIKYCQKHLESENKLCDKCKDNYDIRYIKDCLALYRVDDEYLCEKHIRELNIYTEQEINNMSFCTNEKIFKDEYGTETSKKELN